LKHGPQQTIDSRLNNPDTHERKTDQKERTRSIGGSHWPASFCKDQPFRNKIEYVENAEHGEELQKDQRHNDKVRRGGWYWNSILKDCDGQEEIKQQPDDCKAKESKPQPQAGLAIRVRNELVAQSQTT
jgi:hypothetical protein